MRTGIAGLDKMLHGGFVPGRPYIVSGPPGAGKTILAMQFLREGLEGGERCLFVCLEEPPNELKINMRAFRWNLDDLDVLDANSDIRRFEPTPLLEISTEEEPAKMRSIGERIRKSPDFESKEVSVHSLQQLLKTLLVKKHYERVVIDSITALRYFCMREFEEAVTTQSFMRYLAAEVGPRGVRTAVLWTAGVVLDKEWLDAHPEDRELEVAKDGLINMSMLRKRPTVQQFADTAAFVASDRGSGITASVINVNSGISAR